MHTRQLVFALIAWSVAASARAELVFFSTGRSMSVKAHRYQGDALVLTLRSGAEVICDPALITRIAPDEAPYPEPEQPSVQNPTVRAGAADNVIGEATYGPIIDQIAAREGIDGRLVRAVVQVESGYRPNARSPKGAMGLMQLMPSTARQYAVANPYDPVANIEAGIKHLKSLLTRFPIALALAAYNAGEQAVERYGGVPPYAETRSYVSRILRIVGRS